MKHFLAAGMMLIVLCAPRAVAAITKAECAAVYQDFSDLGSRYWKVVRACADIGGNWPLTPEQKWCASYIETHGKVLDECSTAASRAYLDEQMKKVDRYMREGMQP